MPVNITDEELDIFNQNGFTDDDVKATVENYRNQGLDDNEIRVKIDTRLSSWNNPQPEQPTFIQGGVSKNVQYQGEHPIREAVRQTGRNVARALLPEKLENWFIGSKEEEDFLKEYGNKEVKNYDQLTYEFNNGLISKDEYINGINLRNKLDSAIADDEYRQERNKNIGKGAVDIGTGFIPVGAGAKVATKGAQLLKPIANKTLAKAISQGAVGGAFGGGAMGLGEGLIDRDINPVTQSLLYGSIGGLTGGALGGIGGGIVNKVRANQIAKRKAIPLYERMSDRALDEATTPASNYGVAEDNSEINKELARRLDAKVKAQLESDNIELSAEKDLLKEYKNFHSDLNKKYGSIEKLKKQALKETQENAQYGATTDAMRDYQNLVAFENELANARYVNNPYKIASTGDKLVNENAIQNPVKANKLKAQKQEGLKNNENVLQYNQELLNEQRTNTRNIETNEIARGKNGTLRQDSRTVPEYDSEGSNATGLFVRGNDNLWVINPKSTNKFNTDKVSKISYRELPQDINSSNSFYDAISQAKKEFGDLGAQVHTYTPEEYSQMRLFLSDDGLSGCAVKPDGDIVSVFSNPNVKIKDFRSRSHAMVELAIQNGGKKLDAFDTYLTDLYKKHGFKEVGRDKWNEQYKPEGWNKEFFKKWHKNGEPDVVYMQLEENITPASETADRGLTQSILEAEGTPKEVRELIQNDLPQYRVLHNNELTERAVAEVEKDFYNELSRLSTAKDYDALDYEKSRQIAKRLFQSGRYKEAVNLMDNVAENATEKGQAIQALSLWSNMTPEGAVYKAEKLINAYNKKYPKRKPKSLSDENIKTIQQLQENVLNSADDVSKTQNMARTAKYISELVPANLGKKLKTYRNISLLLNPKTLGRNIIGNVLFNTVDTVAKGLAVPFDRAIGLVTKENTRALPQINKLLKGGLQGLKTGVKEAIEGIDTRGLGQRFDLNTGRTFESPVGKFFETALDVGLRAPDRMQYEATFAESVANMMKAQGLKEPTQAILEQAEKEALESVFQNTSKLSDLTLALRKGFNKIGTENFGLGDLLIPYAQTPANLAQQGINYSPLGALKAIGNLAQGNQRQASLDLARATLGSGIIGGGYTLGKNQLATPSQFDDNYLKNRDIKNNLQTIGIRPDQLGDIWYSPFQPASIPLSVGIASAYGENPYQAATNTLVELPFLQSLSRAISDIKDKGVAEAGINFAGSVPAQFVPTVGSQIGQSIDPYLRETSNSNKIIQGLNQAAVKIPGVSRLYPEKIDVTGKPIGRYSTEGAQRLFDIFINPTFINKKTSDPIILELKNLYDNTKETKQFLLTAEKSLKRVTDENGKALKLDGKQLSDYQKELGQKTYEEFDYLMGSEEYQNADDDKKVDMLNDRRNTIKQLVEFEMFGVPISSSYKNKVNRLYINMK